MDFEPTPEQKVLRESVERFAEGLTRPAGADVDPARGKSAFPAGVLDQLRAMRLMGVVAPPEEGGGGRDHVSYALTLMAITEKSVPTGALLFVNNSLYLHALLSYGTAEQKTRYLRPCCDGDGTGTAVAGYPFEDPGEIRMRAVRNGRGWVLAGEQLLAGESILPSHAVLPAVTDEGPEISLFLLDLRDTAGLRLTREEGGRRRSRLVAEDAVLQAEALLGTQGKGMNSMMESLPYLWVGGAAHAVGIGRSVLKRAVEYSLAAKRRGKAVFSSAAVQWSLADMATELDAAEVLVLRAAWLLDRKKPCEKEAAMAKLYASDAALKAAVNGGQVMGEEGLDEPLGDLLRDAERSRIEQGNNMRIKGYITGRLVRELKGT